MKGITQRFMRKMRRLTRRIKGPFRSRSFRKFMRGGQPPSGMYSTGGPAGPGSQPPSTGMYSTGGPPSQTPINPTDPAASLIPTQGQPAPSTAYLIKVPKAAMNFDFSKATSNLPTSFGTLAPGGADASTFTINLNSKYTPSNLPQFLVTAYVYSSTAGYIHVQRQFGTQSGTAAAGIMIDIPVRKITFTNITKANFPYTANDSTGVALFITLQILN